NIWADAAWQGDEYEMWVQGKVREVTVKGENVLLQRRISTHLGSSRLLIHDQITNDGLAPAPHMMLYHFNFGFPLIAEGTQLIAPTSKKVTPYFRPGEKVQDHTRYAAPIDGFLEQAFLHEMAAEEDGYATVVLANRAFDQGQGLGLYWRYRPAELPYLMQWVF